MWYAQVKSQKPKKICDILYISYALILWNQCAFIHVKAAHPLFWRHYLVFASGLHYLLIDHNQCVVRMWTHTSCWQLQASHVCEFSMRLSNNQTCQPLYIVFSFLPTMVQVCMLVLLLLLIPCLNRPNRRRFSVPTVIRTVVTLKTTGFHDGLLALPWLPRVTERWFGEAGSGTRAPVAVAQTGKQGASVKLPSHPCCSKELKSKTQEY